MPNVVDFSATARSISDRLSSYKSRVDTTIGAGDEMFRGKLDDYLSVTHSAIAQVGLAMLASGRTSFSRILDLPCGHGRVTRGLKAAFPEAELTCCDVNREGVDFCAKQFGATPIYSVPDPKKIPVQGSFDLIWVGSLLTHLDAAGCRAFLDFYRQHLSPNGLLLFTSHGRSAVHRWPRNDTHTDGVVSDFRRYSFGYSDYDGVQGYGTSAFTAAWIADALRDYTDLMLLGYQERGFADHQDLVVVLKMNVHHAQNDLLLV